MTAELEQRLRASVHRGSLAADAEAAAADPASSDADRELAERAFAACRHIADRLESERNTVVALLRSCGATDLPSDPVAPTQRHELVLRVSADVARRAGDALAGAGYRRRLPWTGGAEEAFWRTSHEVVWERTDAATIVVRLRWADPPSGAVSRAFHPRPTDFDGTNRPASLWWTYALSRPARLALERTGVRRRDHDHLEPFLATPQGLLGPLFDTMGVAPDDVLLDVGCGDGRVLVEAASGRGCRGIGIESSTELVGRARTRAESSGVADRVQIVHGSGLATAVDEVTLTLLFLPMTIAERVVPDLLRSLPDGAAVWLHEQSRLSNRLPPPERSALVIGDGAVSVAHRWTATTA